MTPHHREALSNLTYGLASARAITLLIGEAGTGKTTLVRTALSNAAPDSEYVVVSNPALTRAEFVRFLAASFGLSADASVSKAACLIELDALLRERRVKRKLTALLIDEAQSLSDELLEEVRLLSNIETDTEKLLPIVLIGQPELATRINSPSLRQLKQRIALRCELAPLDLSGTASYIASRLHVAGSTPAATFTRDAVIMIHEASQGIPRTINVLCDNALLSGFATGERPVGRRLVADVCRDFSVGVSEANAAAEPAAPTDTHGHQAAEAVHRTSNEVPLTGTDANADVAGDDIPRAGMFAALQPRPRRLSFLWMKS